MEQLNDNNCNHLNSKIDYSISDIFKDPFSQQKKLIESLFKKSLMFLSQKEVHILIVGASGSGKSETINALLKDANIKDQKAISKSGSASVTMDIETFKVGSCILYDSPGLGDNLKLENEHISKIKNKLLEIDSNNQQLIDLVVVILNASNLRNLKSEYQIINDILLPNLKNKEKLIIAINKIDLYDDGYDWDKEKNQPTTQMRQEIEKDIQKLKNKIKDSTGFDVTPIYFSAGRRDRNQKPWNLIKLYSEMNKNVSNEKKISLNSQVNSKKENFENSDNFEKEKKIIKQDLQLYMEDSIRKKLNTPKIEIGKDEKESEGWLSKIVIGFLSGIFSIFSW